MPFGWDGKDIKSIWYWAYHTLKLKNLRKNVKLFFETSN